MNRVLAKARCAFAPLPWEKAQHRAFANGWVGVVDVTIEDGSVVRTLLIERDGNPYPYAVPVSAIIATTAYDVERRSIAVDILHFSPDEEAPQGVTAVTVCVGGNQRKLAAIFKAAGHPV